MIQINTIEQKLAPATLAPVEREVLDFVLPKLGPRMNKWLDEQVYHSSFVDEWSTVFTTLLAVKDMLESLTKGGDWLETVADYLEQSLQDFDYGYGEYFLPFVLDIKEQQGKGGFSIPVSLQQAISKFELKLFDVLPEDEILGLLQYRLLGLIKHTNIFDAIRKVRAGATFGYDLVWAKPFAAALANNEELIGDKQILVDSKLKQPLVQNWIQDFLLSVKKPADARTAIDVIQYIEKSSNFKSVSQEQEQQLLQILKLYAWLTNPQSGYEDPDTILFPDDSDKENTNARVQLTNTPVEPAPVAQNTPPQVPIAAAVNKPKPVVPKQGLPPTVPVPPAPKAPINPTASIPGIPLRSTINIQDLLNKGKPHRVVASHSQVLESKSEVVDSTNSGLSFNQRPSSMAQDLDRIKKDIAAKRTQAQLDIDRKLEALKKRKQS